MAPWLVDRSRIQSYHDCKRLRYLKYHRDRTGLEKRSQSLALVNGSAIHQGLAQLLTGDEIDAVVARVCADYKAATVDRDDLVVAEQVALLEGLLRAWNIVRKPTFLADYDVVSVEQELAWPMGDAIVDMVRCDALLRRKTDQLLFILEFKTVSAAGDGWLSQWEHNSQMLANTKAIEDLYKEPLGGILIEGLIKGRRAMDRASSSPFYGQYIQQSPLCYGYRLGAVYELAWSRGATKVASWDEMPVSRWLTDVMTPEDLAALFASVPPIRPTNRDLDRWHAQTLIQETNIRRDIAILDEVLDVGNPALLEHTLNARFPQNHNHCFRYYGYPCEFENLCFNAQVEEDPIGSGLYQRRTPHHPTEAAQERSTGGTL